MSRWYLLNHQAFCFQTWYYDASSWVGVSCKKINLLLSRSRSLRELIWSKFDSFYYIFRTADPFAIKLGLVVHWDMQECLMKKLDCVQGQGHSKIQNVSKCLSKWYLLNRWTFYYQTWYGDASLWARLSFKKTGLLSSRSRSRLRIM